MTSLDTPSLDMTERPSIALPMAAWGLTLVGLWPIGLVIAYLERGRASPELAAQYRYLIRTVWIGALYLMVSGLLFLALVGHVAMLAVVLWFYARCVKAMLALSRGEPLRDAHTWLV